MPDAPMHIALPSILFSAVGTAGQRCTTTRRLYLHRSIASSFIERLQRAYETVRIGDPLVSETLLGPLHTRTAVNNYEAAVAAVRSAGGEILAGGALHTPKSSELKNGNYVLPTIAVPASSDPKQEIWSKETFAPVLNVAIFDELEQAIAWNNAVPQGLSSSLWTRDLRNVGKWIGPEGSDTGIVNVRRPQHCLDNR